MAVSFLHTLVLAGLLYAALLVAPTLGQGSVQGTVVDGCYVYDGSSIGCMKVNLFQCDNQWDFELTHSVERHTQVILASGIVDAFLGSAQSCFEASDATVCLTFNNIDYDATAATLTIGQVVYARLEGSTTTNIDFGQFFVRGAQCGSAGYFYLPCSRTGLLDWLDGSEGAEDDIPVTVNAEDAQSLVDVARDGVNLADAFASAALSRTDQSLWFVGQDRCMYLIVPNGYINSGDTVLLTCPFAVMDTCSNEDASLVSSAGVVYHFPILKDEPTHSCVDIGGGLNACMYVEQADLDDNTVRAVVSMKLILLGEQLDYTPMGTFLWDFPDCSESMSGCDRIPTFSESVLHDSSFSESIPLLPVSYFDGVISASEYWHPHHHYSPASNHNHGHSPHTNSPTHSHHSDDGDDDDDDGGDAGAALMWTLLSVSILAVISLIVIAIGSALVVIRKREEAGEDLYNLFLSTEMEDVDEPNSSSVVDDSQSLLSSEASA